MAHLHSQLAWVKAVFSLGFSIQVAQKKSAHTLLRAPYGVMHGPKYVAAHVLVKRKRKSYNNNNKPSGKSKYPSGASCKPSGAAPLIKALEETLGLSVLSAPCRNFIILIKHNINSSNASALHLAA